MTDAELLTARIRAAVAEHPASTPWEALVLATAQLGTALARYDQALAAYIESLI